MNEINLHGKDKIYKGRISLISEIDIDKIMLLEDKTNIPEIKASKKTILSRFDNGMKMLGFFIDSTLVSSMGINFHRFFPDRPEELPETFKEYTTPLGYTDYNAVCTNGFNIDHDLRNLGIGSQIAKEILVGLINYGKDKSCNYLLADPRLHTYNGCNCPPIERFRQDPKMKETVDKAIAGERDFTLTDLLRDPEFRVYHRLIEKKTKFLKLMPNTWFPEDYPSGGHGTYVYVNLKE